MFTADDHLHMAQALQLAARGLYTTDPNPRVGCVLVDEGQVVARAWHSRAGGDHAEVLALNMAGERARGSTVYVSLEPCAHHGRTPPCSEALVRAGVSRVIAAMVDPNPEVSGKGLAHLRAAGIQAESGLLAQQAETLNRGFVSRMRRGRPWVRLKLAISLDGRTACASGESKWITAQPARLDAHRLRARSSAILSGIGTVLADDPALTVRLPELAEPCQPLRVVVDTRLRMPPEARMLKLPGQTLVYTASNDIRLRDNLVRAGARVIQVPQHGTGVSLAMVLASLADLECNEITVEAGAVLNGGLLQAGLVDEIVVYLAPHLLGGSARGMFHLPAITRMTDRVPLRITDVRTVGTDLRITAMPEARAD